MKPICGNVASLSEELSLRDDESIIKALDFCPHETLPPTANRVWLFFFQHGTNKLSNTSYIYFCVSQIETTYLFHDVVPLSRTLRLTVVPICPLMPLNKHYITQQCGRGRGCHTPIYQYVMFILKARANFQHKISSDTRVGSL